MKTYSINYQVLILSIVYSIIIIIIDKLKFFKKHKYEPLKLLNYTTWFISSLFTFTTNKFRELILEFCSLTILINFIYETIYHYTDLAHCIHHILTVITIVTAYLTNSVKHDYVLKNINIYYIAFLSSIFSSIRKITKNNNYLKNITYHIYKLSYIVSKSWGIVAHYHVIFCEIPNFDINIKFLTGLSILIHILQLYFIKLIISSYSNV